MKSLSPILAAFCLMLSACGSSFIPGAVEKKPTPEKNVAPRVVIAVMDSGINMYHKFFYVGGPKYLDRPPQSVTQSVLDEFGVTPDCILSLTRTGDFTADYQTDLSRGEWGKVGECNIVWFSGTNVLAKSFREAGPPILPNDEDDTHGVGTTAAALYANPEAVIFFAEHTVGISKEGDAAERFVFAHPAVDIVSTSYGGGGLVPSPVGTAAKGSFEGVTYGGKLFISSCPNSPEIALFNHCGPWWVIGISGFEETQENEPRPSQNGREATTSLLPDFIADYTQTLPYCQACEGGYQDGVGGDSFAAPRSAGIASKIVLEARRMLGHVGGIRRPADGAPPTLAEGLKPGGGAIGFTNWQLRRALEVAAWIPAVTDFDPSGHDANFPSYPVPPAAPWLAVAWGVLTDARSTT